MGTLYTPLSSHNKFHINIKDLWTVEIFKWWDGITHSLICLLRKNLLSFFDWKSNSIVNRFNRTQGFVDSFLPLTGEQLSYKFVLYKQKYQYGHAISFATSVVLYGFTLDGLWRHKNGFNWTNQSTGPFFIM